MRSLLTCLIEEGLEIKHLCVSTDKHPFEAENYPEQIRNTTQAEGIFIDTRVRLFGALPYLWKRGSYNIDRFQSPQMSDRILSLMTGSTFDLVLLESLFLCPYVDLIRNQFNGKIFIRTHNVESDIWFDLARENQGFFKKRLLLKLAKDLRQYEISALPKADGLLTITDRDKDRFLELGIRIPSTTIPVNVACGEPLLPVPNRLFHIGAMDWAPNKKAVLNLIRIFPAIRREIPGTELHIAGRHAQKILQNVSIEGITVHDFVENAGEFMRSCGLLAAPIDSGSGVRIKILEAFANGIPVVTTPTGALGLETLENRCLLICRNDDEFVKACVSLIQSEETRSTLGATAQAYIKSEHSVENIRKKLREFFERT